MIASALGQEGQAYRLLANCLDKLNAPEEDGAKMSSVITFILVKRCEKARRFNGLQPKLRLWMILVIFGYCSMDHGFTDLKFRGSTCLNRKVSAILPKTWRIWMSENGVIFEPNGEESHVAGPVSINLMDIYIYICIHIYLFGDGFK